jgi:hypothetical protein
MKKVTVAILVALFGAAIAVLGATPHVAFAQTASSSASATDDGSVASGAGPNGAASTAGEDAVAAGGDFATCPNSDADDGGCASGTR